MQKNTDEYFISNENELEKLTFDLNPGDRIFFYGDLGVGKSTFIRHLLRKYMNDPAIIVRSPTYTYYQKYNTAYHCDLYRIEDYGTWVSIGGNEIDQSKESILLIEWPEILTEYIQPTKTIHMEILETGERKIIITQL